MPIKITHIATANPPLKLSQQEVLKLLKKKRKLSKRERLLYSRFLGDKGIESRYFSAKNIADFFSGDQDELIRRFEDSAAHLSTASLEKCLRAAGIRKEKIGCLVVTTCTGYLCPGLTSYIIEKGGLEPTVFASDIAGMGCGGALPGLEACRHFLSAHPDSYALMISTEICSSAIFWGDDPELILSNSIFGDGSAACLLTNKKNARGFQILDFESKIETKYRELLRFKTENSKLRNVIKESVPETAAVLMKEISQKLLKRNKITPKDIRFWAIHPGGRKVLDKIGGALDLQEEALESSRTVLRNYGNMSSPSVVYVLNTIWKTKKPRPGDLAFMASFGAGFSGYAALLRYE